MASDKGPMRFAYADPPYLGCASKLYSDATYDDPEAHRALIAHLCNEYPDGWALSCHEPSLHILRAMCPAGTRTAVWVKPFAVFKPNVNPAYAWEPVLFFGGRKFTRKDDTVRDWHSENITLKKGLPGAKPAGFALWLLRLLNVRADLGDTIDDLFPGTGSVMAAWRSKYERNEAERLSAASYEHAMALADERVRAMTCDYCKPKEAADAE